MNKRINFIRETFRVNRLVKFFILSDFMFIGGWGLLAPVFAIFVIEKIEGANLITVGAAVAVYWIVKSIVQIPVALYLDKKEGEKDDFNVLIFSLVLAGFASFLFVLVKTVSLLFLIILIKAIAFGLYTPSWAGIFSRHLDKERYAFDWSLDSTVIGFSSGVAAFIGGAMAKFFGFNSVFIFVGILSLASVFALLSVPNLIFPKPSSSGGPARLGGPVLGDRTPKSSGN